MDAIYTEYATEVRAFTGGDCTCLLEDCFVVNRSVCETCMVPRVILYMRSRLCFHHVGGACPIVCVGHASGVKTVHHRARATSLRGPVTIFVKKKIGWKFVVTVVAGRLIVFGVCQQSHNSTTET